MAVVHSSSEQKGVLEDEVKRLVDAASDPLWERQAARETLLETGVAQGEGRMSA